MIAAHEMGLTDRIRTVRTTVGGTTPHAELMKVNPLGKIPTLELEDGTVIYNSPVIIEYLDQLHTGAKLFPSAWPERLTALRRHALGQGMLDSALPFLGEGFRPPERQSEPHKALWRAQAARLCRGTRNRRRKLWPPAASPWVIWRLVWRWRISIFAFPIWPGANGHPKLAAWHETFDARPSVRANPGWTIDKSEIMPKIRGTRLVRTAVEYDLPVVHDNHPVGDRHRRGDVLLHQHRGHGV